MEVVASLSQGRTAAAECGLFKHKSVPVIFEPPCIIQCSCVRCVRSQLLLQHNLACFKNVCNIGLIIVFLD